MALLQSFRWLLNALVNEDVQVGAHCRVAGTQWEQQRIVCSNIIISLIHKCRVYHAAFINPETAKCQVYSFFQYLTDKISLILST